VQHDADAVVVGTGLPGLRSAARKTFRRLCGVLAQWRTMTSAELVTAADVQLRFREFTRDAPLIKTRTAG
jgi:hypothetical protein